MAEREGFEPSIHLTAYDGLANRCLKPLGHLSGYKQFKADTPTCQIKNQFFTKILPKIRK